MIFTSDAQAHVAFVTSFGRFIGLALLPFCVETRDQQLPA
jgi:hypothetical protein